MLNKGVSKPATEQDHLHRIVLASGNENRPCQSGLEYGLCTDFQAINKRTYAEGFLAPDFPDGISRL